MSDAKTQGHEVAVVCIYHPVRDELLFARRSLDDDLWPGKWYVISEHIEGVADAQGSAAIETAVKGAKVETGLDIGILGLLPARPVIQYKSERFSLWPVVARARSDNIVLHKAELIEYCWLYSKCAMGVLGYENFVRCDAEVNGAGHLAQMLDSAEKYRVFLRDLTRM